MKRTLKIKKLLLSLAVVSTLFVTFASSAFADDSLPTAGEAMSNSATSSAAGASKEPKTTEYDFDGDDVEGNIIKPDETNIGAEQHGETKSLIDMRKDFVSELDLSLDSI